MYPRMAHAWTETPSVSFGKRRACATSRKITFSCTTRVRKHALAVQSEHKPPNHRSTTLLKIQNCRVKSAGV